jgi:hypothetical protein
MKNLFLAFSAILAFATASFAQDAPATIPAPASKTKQTNGQGKEVSQKAKGKSEKGKSQAGEKGKGQMANNLGLTPEQETSFKAFNKSHQEAVKAVNMDKAMAADAKAAKMSALKSAYEANVKGVMNEEQYTKWLASRAKRIEKKAEMGNNKADEPKDKEAKAEGKNMKGKAKGKAKSDKTTQPAGAEKSN